MGPQKAFAALFIRFFVKGVGMAASPSETGLFLRIVYYVFLFLGLAGISGMKTAVNLTKGKGSFIFGQNEVKPGYNLSVLWDFESK